MFKKSVGQKRSEIRIARIAEKRPLAEILMFLSARFGPNLTDCQFLNTPNLHPMILVTDGNVVEE